VLMAYCTNKIDAKKKHSNLPTDEPQV